MSESGIPPLNNSYPRLPLPSTNATLLGFFAAESQAETVKYSALLSPLLLLSPRKLCYYVQYQNQQDFQGGKSSQVAAGEKGGEKGGISAGGEGLGRALHKLGRYRGERHGVTEKIVLVFPRWTASGAGSPSERAEVAHPCVEGGKAQCLRGRDVPGCSREGRQGHALPSGLCSVA